MRQDPCEALETAKEHISNGRPDRALGCLERPFPRVFRAQSHFLRGEALRHIGHFDHSRAAYEVAIKSCDDWDEDILFDSYMGLAYCARSLGQTGKARSALRKARRIRGADLDALHLETAMLLRAESHHHRAVKSLAPLLVRVKRDKDYQAIGFILWAIAGSRRFMGDLNGSLRDFGASYTAYRRAGDREGVIYALFGLGGAARIRGRFEQACRAYQKAGRMLEGGVDRFGQAYASCGLANCLRQMGQLELAMRHYRIAHRQYASIGDEVDLGFVEWGMGQIEQRRGRLAQAQRRYSRALAMFLKGNEHRGQVLAQKSLAEVLHAQGRTAKAEILFDAAVRQARKTGLTAHLEIYT